MLCQGRGSVLFCIVLVVASGACLAQEELVAIIRSEAGDMVRLTTEDGVCKNRRCPAIAPTYEGGERPCVDDSILQRSKQ